MPHITIDIAAKAGRGASTLATHISDYLSERGFDVSDHGEDRDAELKITHTQLPRE
jgi:hypothetical protein